MARDALKPRSRGRKPSGQSPPARTSAPAPVWSFFRRHVWVGYLTAFVTILIGLVLVRLPIIDSPPYYDFATGLFLEANFLADTNFDYQALVQQQSRWLEGGAAVYITSIMPTLVALLMKLLPTARSVLIAYHLFNFACAAIAGMLLFAVLRPRIGPAGASLTSAMLLTAPLFSTQIDMLGMDLPMAVCALAAVLCVSREHYLLAAVAGLATSLIKVPGRAVTGALMVYMAILLLLSVKEEIAVRRRLWIALGVNLVIFAGQQLESGWIGGLPQSKHESWTFSRQLFGGNSMITWTPKWFPDQVAIFALAAGGSLTSASVWLNRQFKQKQPLLNAAYAAAVEYGSLLVGWTIAIAVITALALVYCLPRYFMLALPFIYLAFGRLLFARPAWRMPAGWIAALIVLFNLANADGRFYPAIPEAERTGALLERSREYLADHRSNISAVHRLAAEYSRATIIAATPFVHFLSLPRLGYVDQPLHGYSLNRFTTPEFVSGMRLPHDLPRDVVLIYANNPFTRGVIPPPRPADTIIYQDQLRSPLIVYQRRWPSEMSTASLKREYEMLVLPEEGLVAVARQYAQAGDYQRASESFLRAIAIDLYDGDAYYGLGFVRIKQGLRAQGMQHLRSAIRLDPNLEEAHALLGAALADERQFDEAVKEFHRALELNPKDFNCLTALARVYLQQGNRDEAIRYYAEALKLRPADLQLQQQLEAARSGSASRPMLDRVGSSK